MGLLIWTTSYLDKQELILTLIFDMNTWETKQGTHSTMMLEFKIAVSEVYKSTVSLQPQIS